MISSNTVLHLINGEHYSGAERVQDLLALGLSDFGYRVAFACVKPNRFPRVRLSRQVPLFEAAMNGRLDLGIVPRLLHLVRTNDYRLLHAHTPRTALLGSILARWTGLPLVYHVHSPVGRDSTNAWQNWLNQRVESFSLRTARHLITVSESLGAYMCSLGTEAKKITVVCNGVPAPTRMRHAAPPTGPWTIGTVALFRPRKGTEVLLDAIAILRGEGIDVRLKAIGGFGSPEYEASLKQRTTDRGLNDRVEWTGFTTEVAASMQSLDAFVLPSLFGEGLPMVVLEAMASGIPIVATRVEGVPEAIQDEVHGLLVRPNDPVDLSRSLKRLIRGELDWSSLRESALRRHKESFSDTTMCRGVARVYDRLLAIEPASAGETPRSAQPQGC